MYRDCVQTYKNAVRRHEREAAEFAKEIARIVSNSASDTSFKKEKKKEGEDEDKITVSYLDFIDILPANSEYSHHKNVWLPKLYK